MYWPTEWCYCLSNKPSPRLWAVLTKIRECSQSSFIFVKVKSSFPEVVPWTPRQPRSARDQRKLSSKFKRRVLWILLFGLISYSLFRCSGPSVQDTFTLPARPVRFTGASSSNGKPFSPIRAQCGWKIGETAVQILETKQSLLHTVTNLRSSLYLQASMLILCNRV